MTSQSNESDQTEHVIREVLARLSDLEDHAYYSLNDGYTVRSLREVQSRLESVIPPGVTRG